jgi:hypothetical protein
MLRRYRSRGADPPFGDPRRAHGVAMEGYFWRFSDVRTGRVIVALCGVCRPPDEPSVPADSADAWATVALAAHPGGFLRRADLPRAGDDRAALGVWARGETGSLSADGGRLTADLGPDARLDVRLAAPWPARRALLGGSGAAHLIPGLGQYWHPHLFAATVSGSAVIGGETIDLTGWQAYAEKNWSPHASGFPAHWWWGQAHGFDRADVAVAFAGGELTLGPARLTATGVVVALDGRLIRLGNPVLAPARVRADGRTWTLRARGPRWSVQLDGTARPGEAHVLPVPVVAQRRSVLTAHEHLAARIELVVRRRGRVVYAGASELAGLELGPQ